MAKESLGIKAIESVHWYVHDLERSRRFYLEKLDFAEVGRSSEELERAGRQRSLVFQAGNINLVVSQPVGEGGRAWRYLRKHPDGVGTINFQVEDVERTFRILEKRGGTFIQDIQRFTDSRGNRLAFFSITTPFGETTFRFVQRDGDYKLYPGMEAYEAPRGGQNSLGLTHVDHITSNFRTMAPMVLWMEHVMGFERFWEIDITTASEEAEKTQHGVVQGTGLRSKVMWDPESRIKFANNEPYRPHFKKSQINIFVEDQRGEGVQHLALAVKDLVSAVDRMRARGLEFMPTPDSYYDTLPRRIDTFGIKRIDENVEDLRRLRILLDGDAEHSYLLQIFMKDAAGLYGDPEAGPFFYEFIQRKGNQGFGGGNFRTLFESIEREQRASGRI